MHLASATIVARGDPQSPTPTPTPTPTFSQRLSTSFFTFLIALILLVCASGVLILRAVLKRRRHRRRVQEAIDAGIIPNIPSFQHKPELYEVCVRAAGDTMDWQILMPVCATNIEKTQPIQADVTHKPNRSVLGRLRELSGHRSTPVVSNDARDDEPLILQVAVLIAMPSEHPNIPSLHSVPPQALGERQDSSMEVNDHAFPDLIFGVSTFPVISDEAD